MRLFHLADLHLGKCIHGYSMIEMGDQPYWMEQLLKKADELRPDAVLIAGDVYDRAVPSKEAVNLFDEFLTKFAERKIPVLLIAGNHDSGSRLSFADKLLCRQGIHIAGEVNKEVKSVTLEDAYGPVHFWLVPYLFPAAVNVALKRDDLKDYDSAMRAILEEQKIEFGERNVILSHQFVVAGEKKPAMGGSETTVEVLVRWMLRYLKVLTMQPLVISIVPKGWEKVRFAMQVLLFLIILAKQGRKKG